MEFQEQLRSEVKSNEKAFSQKLETLIEQQYKRWLFSKYLISLEKVQTCYSSTKSTLAESDSCSQSEYLKYSEIEYHVTRVLRKYEDGIIHCVTGCGKDIQPVIFFRFL